MGDRAGLPTGFPLLPKVQRSRERAILESIGAAACHLEGDLHFLASWARLGRSRLYRPQGWIRLMTGYGMARRGRGVRLDGEAGVSLGT